MTVAYLGIRIRWSTAGLCSHQSSDIYTPGCSGAPSYYLWTLEGGIKQQLMRQLTTNASSVCAVTHAACTRTDFLVHREAKEEVTLITNCVHKKLTQFPLLVLEMSTTFIRHTHVTELQCLSSFYQRAELKCERLRVLERVRASVGAGAVTHFHTHPPPETARW